MYILGYHNQTDSRTDLYMEIYKWSDKEINIFIFLRDESVDVYIISLVGGNYSTV